MVHIYEKRKNEEKNYNTEVKEVNIHRIHRQLELQSKNKSNKHFV